MGTLRRTLLHVCDAETIAEYFRFSDWARRQVEDAAMELADDQLDRPFVETTSIAELAELSRSIAARRNDMLSALRGPELERPVRARPRAGLEFSFALGDTMLQLPCHGTHHRAQALNMLRRLGARVPAIDYLDWMRQGSP